MSTSDDLGDCIDYNGLSIFIVSVLGAAGACFTALMTSVRKSRCTDMNFCCGCLVIHRELMSLDEMKADNRLAQASPSGVLDVPSQQFMRKPIASSGTFGMNNMNNRIGMDDVRKKNRMRVGGGNSNGITNANTPPATPTNRRISMSSNNENNYIIDLQKTK